MSFFGKKEDDKAKSKSTGDEHFQHGAAPGIAPGRNYQITTGGQLDEMVVALIKSAHDPDARTQKSFSTALFDIGLKQPNLVASSLFDFLVNDNKHSQSHRVQLLQSLEKVISERREKIDAELCRNAMTLALADMIRAKEVVPDWQGAASSVLITLGMRFPDDLMKELLKLFSPGTVPHYFVIKTFGDFLPANPLAAVPRLKEVLARVVPVLASIKAPNMKWVFATALGNFCEAMLHYVANIEDGSNASAGANTALTLDSFSSEIFPCYEVLFATWLTAKEPKVRLATIKALGSMCAVMPRSNFEEQLPRLIPALLGLYKKEKKHLPITQGMCSVLSVAVKDDSPVLEPLLPALFAALHPLACQPADQRDSSAIKNSNELHRCFGIIGLVFAEPLVTFLVGKLESKDARLRAGTLQIFKHLVTRNDHSLEPLKSMVMAGVKPLVVAEKDLRVRKALAQLIISLAAHNYLLLSGGEAMIDFIVLNSATSDEICKNYQPGKKAADDDVSPGELRNLCDNVLNLVTTTVDGMHEVLWPFLFESLIKPELSGALGVVCKCLAYIAHTKRESDADDYIIDFDRAVNLPKPPALLARLLVCVARPHGRNALGAHVLHLLRAAGPLLHPSACDMWDQAAPRLLNYLEQQGSGADFQQARWEELVLRLLEKTLEIADDDAWAMELGDEYANQFALYSAPAEADLKKVALKHLGVVVQKLQHREFIRTKLDVMFRQTNHASDVERQGCAQGFGYAASSHLDIVVDYLVNADQTPAKSSSSGGGGGFLSSLFSKKSEKSDGGATGALNASGERGKATIVLCYGYVCAYGPPSQVAARVDVHIIPSMKPHLTNAKSEMFKRAATQSIDLIGKAMNPAHLKQAYTLKHRDALVKFLVNFMTAGEVTPLIRTMGLSAIATLTRLTPALPEEDEAAALAALLPFFDLQVVAAPAKDDKKKKSRFGKGGNNKAAASTASTESAEELLEATQANLRALLLVLLAPKPDAETLVRMFRHLEKWLTSAETRHRERAMAAVLCLLNEHLRLLRARQREGHDIPPKIDEFDDGGVGHDSKVTDAKKAQQAEAEAALGFGSLGACLAMVVPRCTDPKDSVRPAAIAAIETLLYTDHLLTHHTAAAEDAAATAAAKAHGAGGEDEDDDDDEDDGAQVPAEALPERLASLRQHRVAITAADTNSQYRVMQTVAKDVLARPDVLNSGHLLNLLLGCLRGLGDPAATSTSGTCVVLNSCIGSRGVELLPQVKQLTDGLLAAMEHIKDPQTLNGTLHAVRTLASHHLLPVVNQLLDRPLPQSQHTVRALQVLAKDAKLGDPLITHLTDIVNNGQLYDEGGAGGAVSGTGDGKTSKASSGGRVPQPLAMSATAALAAVLSAPEGERLAETHYALLATTALLRVGTSQGSAPPSKESGFGPEVRAETGAADLVREFLSQGGDKAPLRALEKEGSYARLATPQYGEPLTAMTGAICKSRSALMPELFSNIAPYIKGNFTPQRVVAALIIGEMVCHVPVDPNHDTSQGPDLLERLVQTLMASLIDADIKKYALRGLGNVVAAGEAATNRYAPTVLDALTSSMEHADEEIVLEAMAGLSKVFGVVEESRVAPILVNICHRIRPAFGKQNNGIRAEAFRLFGTLARFGGTTGAADAFYEQLHANLPLLLLHLADDSRDVSGACREALVRLAPLVRNEAVQELLEGRHLKPERTLQYGEFADDISKVLIAAYPERINYIAMTCVDNFKSIWDTIKGNAALMAGVLLGNIPLEARRSYNLNPMLISRALIQLLADRAPTVRQRAAEAMSLLHTY